MIVLQPCRFLVWLLSILSNGVELTNTKLLFFIVKRLVRTINCFINVQAENVRVFGLNAWPAHLRAAFQALRAGNPSVAFPASWDQSHASPALRTDQSHA